jgi:hypothetical protein
MLQAKLKVVGGRHHGRVIPLATKKFLIGREQDCHLRPNSELVSRHHCVFAVDDFSVRLRDLGSTNGTFVNDHRVRGEVVLNTGDRIRVGKLDFELVVGEPIAAAGSRKGTGDSSHFLPGLGVDASVSETAPLGANDTSFEIPVPVAPEDTGSSIIADTTTPVPAAAASPAGPSVGDSTVVWTPPPASPGYAPEMYPPMGMAYPQAPYQPGYPYMAPSMGYQPQYPYPQMPMGYPGMYPQMGPQMGMYQPQPAAPAYAPPQPTAAPEAQEQEDDTANSMPNVRLPDPKTTGAKAPAPPAAPAVPEPAKQVAATDAEGNPLAGATEEKKPEPPAKPSEGAADILKRYTQRRPV